MTFCKNDMDVTESFSNEVSLFDRDFIKSMIEMMEYEAQLEDFITVVPQHYLGKEGTLEKISRVKANHQHFFGKNGKYKSANELRSTSDPYIFKKYNTPMDQPNTGFVTESYKWKRVKSHEPFRKYILVFFGYKIFSQFQHYSKRSMELLDQKHEAMLFYHLCLSIDAVRIITDMQIQIIDTNQSPYLERLREVGKGIEEIFNNK